MPRLPRFLSPATPLAALLLAALPTAATADEPAPAGEAVQVALVPAYTVAPAAASPGMAAPGVAPLYVPADEPAVADEAVGLARRVRDDRVAERGYLAPTALVAPAGTTTFTMQAPILPGASFRLDRSFSDRLSLGVGVVGVLDNDDLFGIGNLNAKYQLARGRRAALAATLSLVTFADGDDDKMTIALPGVAGSYCLSDECRTLVSGNLYALAGVDDEVLPIVGGVSVAHGFMRQLIAEIHTTTADEDRLWAGFIGGRFIGQRWALDAGIGFAAVAETAQAVDCIDFCADTSSRDVEVNGLPFFALSTRL